jgi:hypothetical protein
LTTGPYRVIRLIDRFAACFIDGRVTGRVTHDLPTLIGPRVFGIALAQPDCAADPAAGTRKPVPATTSISSTPAPPPIGRRDLVLAIGKAPVWKGVSATRTFQSETPHAKRSPCRKTASFNLLVSGGLMQQRPRARLTNGKG